MITVEYVTKVENTGLINLVNRVSYGVRDAMELVLDHLVQNIQGHFTDAELAATVEKLPIVMGGISGSADVVITGRVTSSWANMIYYEEGRPPGGKMPPLDALVAYATKKGIQPDPDKTQLAFAFAINAARRKKDKKPVSIDVLVEWQKRTGVVVPVDFAVNSMAYGMGMKIVKEGIAGKHYFALGLQETMPVIHDSFENVVIATTGIR